MTGRKSYWSPDTIKKARSDDFKRFVKRYKISPEGELADQSLYEMDEAPIQAEQQYDGIYAVCTNLEDPAAEIAEIKHRKVSNPARLLGVETFSLS